MEVLAHSDPFVLEKALLDRIAAVRRQRPLAPVLVIVPTGRLARHVQRRIGERLGACLAVHVLHYRSLILRVLESAGGPSMRPLSPALQRTLLAAALDRLPPNPWSEIVRRRPGALGGLLATLRDLRDAGANAHQVTRLLREDDRQRWLARLYREFEAALRGAAERGFADEAGLAAAALAHLTTWLKRARFESVMHHGAYELIGVHLDLIRELDRIAGVSVLLPADPGTPSGDYGSGFARRRLIGARGKITRLDDCPGGLLGSRLPALYDETSRPEPLGSGRVVLRNCQGADPEITLAVRSALRAVEDGTPPEEIAIVARSLTPYAANLHPLLGTSAMPTSSSLRVPLRRHPAVHDLLVLLRAAAEDFPRPATVEVLCSPRVRWSRLGERRPSGDLAEAWSRQAKILGGLAAWTRELREWADDVHVPEDSTDEERKEREERRRWRRESAERVGRAVAALARRLEPVRAHRWKEHAARLESVVREVLPGSGDRSDDPCVNALVELLDEMGELDALLETKRTVPFAEMVAWLERAVDGTDVPLQESDSGGIHVLDMMQARGLTFRRVILVGMNERLFPRIPREDPVLPDRARRRLAEETGRPVPVKGEGDREERLLLALTLGSAGEQVEISWQRSDETGRVKTPSMALREVARILAGKPDLRTMLEESRRVPAHPENWLEALCEEFGMISGEENRVLVALRNRGPDSTLSALESEGEGLRRGLEMLSATESFDPKRHGIYDGRVGPTPRAPSRFSATSLKTLGRCPLQYFFERVLRVCELEDETSPHEIPRRELGSLAHETLERLYALLLREGSFEAGDPEGAAARAAASLPHAWSETTAPWARRMAKRLPALWAHLDEAWLASLEAFVREDLEDLGRDECVIRALEDRVAVTVDLGGGVEVAVDGRFDRIVDGPDGGSIGDYKTSGKLEKTVDITQALKARHLQAPLYHLLGGGRAVEMIGVGPGFDPRETARDDRRYRFDGFEKPEQRVGFLETLRVLVQLTREGVFPLRPEHHCGWCAYALACRRKHPPTIERERHSGSGEAYRLLDKKTKSTKPTLAAIRSTEENA